MNRALRFLLIAALFSTQSLCGWAAIGSTTIWHVRVGGNNANGGGYDSAVSGATTDYTDQDAAALTLTDIATTGGTTVTSITGGFTTAMIGNCLRIIGDNYYFITARTNTNTITVDRATGTGVAQTGSVGGAFATLLNFYNGGSITQPAITTPLAPGHIVYIRGNGSDNPVVDDYTLSAADYVSFPNGDTTSGRVQFVGYNGRPRINNSGLMFYTNSYISLKNLCFFLNASGAYPQYGLFNTQVQSVPHTYAENVKVDTNGVSGAVGLFITTAIKCTITNSGTTSSSGVGYGLFAAGYAGLIIGCVIEKQRGGGLKLNTSISSILGNLIINNAQNGIDEASILYGDEIAGNTIYGNGGDGIGVIANGIEGLPIINNIIALNGGYGINAVGSSTVNDKLKPLQDYNDFYSNTSGAYNGVTGGTHDLTLDPQFTNAAGGDFSIGTNLKAMGFPSLIAGSTTTAYVDIGAAQRQESGGGAAGTKYFPFVQ